jgi:hypothetical protein
LSYIIRVPGIPTDKTLILFFDNMMEDVYFMDSEKYEARDFSLSKNLLLRRMSDQQIMIKKSGMFQMHVDRANNSIAI